MPGLLSTIFDGNDDGRADQSTEQDADAGLDLHLDPSITVTNHMSGTYDTPDGGSHSWERTDSVTVESDTLIVAHVTSSLDGTLVQSE